MFIVPVANTAYIRRRPWVTVGLVAVNTAIWLYGAVAPGPSGPAREIVQVANNLYRRHARPFENVTTFLRRLDRGMVVSRRSTDYREWAQARRLYVASREGMGEYLAQVAGFVPARGFDHGLITSLFLHGDFMHLLMNMVFLFLFGCSMEDQWGRWRYGAFYVAAGLVANLAHYASAPGSALPLVGASGAISGVMGAFVVFHAMSRIKFFWWLILFGFFEVPAWVAIAAWFFLQVLNVALFHLTVVAYWAHIGGFVFGLAIALPVRLIRGPLPRRHLVPDRTETTVALPGTRELTRAWDYQDALYRGEDLLQRGEPAQAATIFEKILERDPGHLEARWGQVRAYQAMGRRSDALRLGEELMVALIEKGRHREARKVYALLMSAGG